MKTIKQLTTQRFMFIDKDDADLNWDKPQTKTVKYKNMYEDPGSTSVRTGINSENEFEHLHTFKSPKFTTRGYYKTLLGQGHPAADEEYLRNKKRI